VSRYRFVYPIERDHAEAIAACEAAWAFYGGIFRAMVVDNMKAIVTRADPLEAKINDGFSEYAQARGFFVDATRVRRPKDKPRVERAVRDVRDDCFAGERLLDLDCRTCPGATLVPR
jgi:transposase